MKSPADPFETVLPAPMVAPVPVRIPGMAGASWLIGQF